MSEHLTHIAVYEDLARLVIASDGFSRAFRESLERAWDAGLLTAASRGNHLYAVPFLEEARTRWQGPGEVERRIAAAIGWITHRAADLQMKPLGRELEAHLAANPDPLPGVGINDTEFEIYQDAVTFREVYDGGRVQPGTPYAPLSPATLAPAMASHPAAAAVDVAQVEVLLATQVQHDLLRLHTFTDREQALDAWIDAFLGRVQGFTEDLEVYVDSYQEPDPVKMIYYMDRINWYDAGDEVIRWARALQRGTEPPPGVPVEEAVRMGRTQSQYAQALHKGMHFLSAANAFFEHRMEKSDLYDTLEIWPEDHRR